MKPMKLRSMRNLLNDSDSVSNGGSNFNSGFFGDKTEDKDSMSAAIGPIFGLYHTEA